LIRFRHVASHGNCTSSKRFDLARRSLRAGFIDVGQHQLGTGFSEGKTHRPTDALGCTRHKGHTTRQIK
jgi:hypothetical protein